MPGCCCFGQPSRLYQHQHLAVGSDRLTAIRDALVAAGLIVDDGSIVPPSGFEAETVADDVAVPNDTNYRDLLTFPVVAGTLYLFKFFGVLYIDQNSDIKFTYNGPAPTDLHAVTEGGMAGSGVTQSINPNVRYHNALGVDGRIDLFGSDGGYVRGHGMYIPSADGTFALRVARWAAGGGTVTVYKGMWLEHYAP